MKYFFHLIIIFFVFLMFLPVSWAADAEKDSGKQPAREQEKNKQTITENNTNNIPKLQNEPWPRTFVPTEKIKADTVVSFPADI